MAKINKRRRSYQPKQTAQHRQYNAGGFYQSKDWRRLRNAFIKENNKCVECYRLGVVTVATVADHVQPIRLGGAPLDVNNLQAMCERCHNIKSAKERLQK